MSAFGKYKLTSEEKLFVLSRIKSGEPVKDVAKSVGVRKSSILLWLRTEEKIKLAAQQERYVAEYFKNRQEPAVNSPEIVVNVHSPSTSIASSSSPQMYAFASSSSSNQEVQEQPDLLQNVQATTLEAPEGSPVDLETRRRLQEQAVFMHPYYVGLYSFIVQHCGLPEDLRQQTKDVDPAKELMVMPELNLVNYARRCPEQNGNGSAKNHDESRS